MKVSNSNTKVEILEEVERLQNELKEAKKDNKVEVKKQTEVKEIVDKASSNSVEAILGTSSKIKGDMIQVVEELESQIISAQKTLTDTNIAVEAQRKELEELFGIKASAESLEAMQRVQATREVEFEEKMRTVESDFAQKMAETRVQWEKQKAIWQETQAEEKAKEDKRKAQENEEYIYKTRMERRNDRDKYEQERLKTERELAELKINTEKELDEREEAIAVKENEYNSLVEKVSNFPEEMNKAIKAAVGAEKGQAEQRAANELRVAQMEANANAKLAQQTIDSLRTKIEEQAQQISELKITASNAVEQVRVIATEAVQSAGRQSVVYNGADNTKK